MTLKRSKFLSLNVFSFEVVDLKILDTKGNLDDEEEANYEDYDLL